VLNGSEVIGPPVGWNADIQLRRYTQITQRHQPRGRWTGKRSSCSKVEQLDRLKSFYADPLTGDLDPHRFLGQRVSSTFAKDNHTTVYEGTVVSFDFLSINYGISWDDGDYVVDNSAVTINMIENWFVKTGQVVDLSELQQCPATALDKILLMCESFPDCSDEVYILRNLASILSQLLFVYGTRTEQVRRAHDLFNQGRWQDLWKLALKAGERAKARAAKNPRQSKAKSEPQKEKYAQKCVRRQLVKSCEKAVPGVSSRCHC
jgi:hypothetical protein